MDRPKSTSTLTSSNVLSSTVWSVIVPNVSNATSSLITSSMNLQGYAKYASWKTVFNVKHSLHAGSVMEIQAWIALQGSARSACYRISYNVWICKNAKSVMKIMISTRTITQENASIAKLTYAWTARALSVVSSATKLTIISSTRLSKSDYLSRVQLKWRLLSQLFISLQKMPYGRLFGL